MSRARGLVFQERDKHLMRELATMRVIDREQAKQVAQFQSTTRANARLLALLRAGALRRFFLGATAAHSRSLYCLSQLGAQLVDVPYRGLRRKNNESLAADFFVRHQLCVNDLYVALKYGEMPQGIRFRRWLPFVEPITPDLPLIPDGYVELETPSRVVASFIEVDLGNESLSIWRKKIDNYLELADSGEFEMRFRHPASRTLVLAVTDRRLSSLRKAVAAVTEKVFWFANLEAIRERGFFASIWTRPQSDEQQAFLPELS